MRVTRRGLFTLTGSFVLAGTSPSLVSAEDQNYKQEFEEVVDGFGEMVRTKIEEDESFFKTLTDDLTELEKIEVENFENEIGDTKEQVRRTRKIIDVLESDLNITLPGNFKSSVKNISDDVNTVDKYLPVVAAGQNCLQCAEEYQMTKAAGTEEDLKEAEEELLIAALVFVSEVCLLQSTTTYRLSFRGTRYVANHGLFRVQRHVGTRTYALLLSEVHWGIRGTLNKIKSRIIERTLQIISDLSSDLSLGGWWLLRELRDLDRADLHWDFLEQESYFEGSTEREEPDESVVNDTSSDSDNDKGWIDSTVDRIFGDDDEDDGIFDW